MGEHDKVEVIEKHYHGQQEKSGNGLAVAGLTTGTVGAAGALTLIGLELAKAVGSRIANGGRASSGAGCANAGGIIAGITSAVAPMIAAVASPRQSEPRIIPVPVGESGEVAELRAKVSRLEAEKYSDNAAKEESNRLLVNYLKPYGQEIADSRVREATLRGEVACLKETQELRFELAQKDIALAKQEAKCCCEKNAAAIAILEAKLGAITSTVIPSGAVCTARLG